jgi:copper chaperone CopZ
VRVLPHRLFVFPRARLEASFGPHDSARTTLRVEGLVCSLCAARTQAALQSLPGVWRASVDLDAGSATVEHDRALVEAPALVRAVDSAVVLRPLRRVLAALATPWRGLDRHWGGGLTP